MTKEEIIEELRKELEELKKLKLGPTGNFPRGKMDPSDRGGIEFTIALDRAHKSIILSFGAPVTWLGLGKDDATIMGQLLLQKAAAL